jgi:hypothetical protein
MPQKIFKSGSGLALIVPKELAKRCHIEAGDSGGDRAFRWRISGEASRDGSALIARVARVA